MVQGTTLRSPRLQRPVDKGENEREAAATVSPPAKGG